MSAYIVGLTGGIGSGKSTVADLFQARGAELVDTDAIAHALTAPGGAAMPALRAAFGAEVVRPDGALDRAVMRQRVFADTEARHRLEAILHPMIRAEAAAACAAAHSAYVILAVPLLLESGHYRERCDRILVVDCPVDRQIERVMARSGLSADEARAILRTQASREARRAIADDLIDNSGTRTDLVPSVDALDQQYRQLALKKAQGKC